MNISFFIASKLIKGKATANKYTKPIILISITAIAISLMVMLVATSIVSGFQNEIRNKVIGFGGHIQITSYSSSNTYEADPIERNQAFYGEIKQKPSVKNIQIYAQKAGIIKTKEEIYGVIVKGIGKDYDWSFFKNNLVKGSVFEATETGKGNEILISQQTANQLKLDVGDKLFLYFFQSNGELTPKDFIVKGIYKSGFDQFDKLFVITDIAHLRKKNGWTPNQIGGFEINIKHFDEIEKVCKEIYETIPYDLNASTIIDLYPDIFNWVELQDINVVIIITLMIVVALINITSALLILILDKTNMIGILKALGMTNWKIRKIFIYHALYLVSKGLIYGNLIGLGLCFIQYKYGIIKLPQESYYIDKVPINFEWSTFILLNAGTIIVCGLTLILPSYLITRITPVKAIRFD